jgi:hypothetical protein
MGGDKIYMQNFDGEASYKRSNWNTGNEVRGQHEDEY